MNVGYNEDQKAEKDEYLDHIVDEELNIATDTACNIKTAKRKKPSYQLIQPFHTENLVLYEIPYLLHNYLQLHLYIYMCRCVGFVLRSVTN